MGSLWNRSGTVERYADDLRAVGAKAFFFEGGTTLPLTVYRDSGQSSPHPHPVVADANGRWPDVFVPFVVSYDVQVMSADNVQLTFSLQIPNPNPVSGGDIISPTSITTGMIHAEFVDKEKPGYVRLNGRTIGPLLSSATEMAGEEVKDLFFYLYANLANDIAPVIPDPRTTVDDDWLNKKTIKLPDCRGTGFIGMDTMGTTAAGAFTGLTFGSGSGARAGSFIGGNAVTLTIANLPAHTHTGTTDSGGAHTHLLVGSTDTQSAAHGHAQTGTHAVAVASSTDLTHDHSVSPAAIVVQSTTGNIGAGVIPFVSAAFYSGVTGPVLSDSRNLTHGHSGTVALSGTTSDENTNHTHSLATGGTGFNVPLNHTHTFTTSLRGDGGPFNNLSFSRLVTWYIKL
jgi:hypothetical protein